MPNSPEDALASMIANFPSKTGKTLDEWVTIAKTSGLSKHMEIVKDLKTRHGIGHGYANLVAMKTLESPSIVEAGSDSLVDAQYAGPKTALRPIYDKLIARVLDLGSGVEVSPKKTYVSLRRNKQFALVQPTTKTRVDVGINLKGVPAGERLQASGSFNAMVSHRVGLSSVEDVDDELLGWLREAYDGA